MSEHPHHAVEATEPAELLTATLEALDGGQYHTARKGLLLAIAALTAQQTATAGWRLVPVEPTREMRFAWECMDGNPVEAQWAAMLAAAPQQTATAVSREEIARLRRVPNLATVEASDYRNGWNDAIGEVLSLLSGGEGLARAEAGR